MYKKNYIRPVSIEVKISGRQSIAETSYVKMDNTEGNKLNDSGDILGRQNSGWDIWGSEEEYDEDYDY